MSKSTVKYHIRNIYTKINLNNRNELEEKMTLTMKKQKNICK
ncbi:LuxR C-terminal-related transcriptional regulator [Polaribacter sp. Hel1_85]